MKKTIICFAFGLLSCNNNADFKLVKSGMPSSTVINLVGKPESEIVDYSRQLWLYNKQNKRIILWNDTVVAVEEYPEELQDNYDDYEDDSENY